MIDYIDFSNRQNRFVTLSDVSNDYLSTIEKIAKEDTYYPSYHIAPHHGLMNDPNGLAFFRGEHHIFYQWFPLGPVHGLKHWYHVSTKDFIHFKDHGIALYPDQLYDSHGCHSGSAFVEGDKMHLFYTGNHLTEQSVAIPSQVYGFLNEDQTISKENVMIEGTPPEFSNNFRDPIVFKRDKKYYMLVGGETTKNKGAIALYSGDQPNEMTYRGILQTNFKDAGYMWECPNYFEQNNHGVLIFSPQGELSTDKYQYNNVFSVVYCISDVLDVATGKLKANEYIELDKGFDFYAPQTYEDACGRRILIGWLGNSKSIYPTDQNMWAHMLTLPREVKIEGNRLLQQPLQELRELRAKGQNLQTNHHLTSRAFEMVIKVDREFEIIFRNEVNEAVVFSSNGEEYCLDRSNMTHVYAEEFGTKRYALRKQKEKHQIRLFIDSSSIEIFCDHGETVLTSRMFIEGMNVVCCHGVSGDLYPLNQIVKGTKPDFII
ncbi:sucrose-6-phosphate hydrolase [Bacillus hwajinpoensis]|uniref:Sucrose-6-phosphate hydrolase n=1 Tax=Guptibacillus hwajinpoensis TaxID=208199 RepID=A0A845F0H4_9BACL|nr:sucrose-6-phosphate hydrolase [Pseudalkalibacillus hwajinpoensis]MYL64279.1 sucrose-6-phosphate hydrolase [Pseudalkalibacillus hwajinpoensis]